MIEPLLGSKNRERVLLFLHARDEGYAREISRFYKTDLSQIQKQLERLEIGNILYSKTLGKTRTSTKPSRSSRFKIAILSFLFVVIFLSLLTIPPIETSSPS